MVDDFKTMVVKKPTILGSTTINHAARIELDLTCSDYVLMDYIYRAIRDKKPLDTLEIYRQTGFEEQAVGVILNNLVLKGFVVNERCNLPKITDKWASAFTNLTTEFEELFWRKNGKVFFTGSKKKSYEFYSKLRKKYSKDFLVKQRDAYADYLEMEHKTGFDRSVMMAERWLHPSNEYYLSDWSSQANLIREKILKGTIVLKKSFEIQTKEETVTSEERKSRYEQDSNQ